MFGSKVKGWTIQEPTRLSERQRHAEYVFAHPSFQLAVLARPLMDFGISHTTMTGHSFIHPAYCRLKNKCVVNQLNFLQYSRSNTFDLSDVKPSRMLVLLGSWQSTCTAGLIVGTTLDSIHICTKCGVMLLTYALLVPGEAQILTLTFACVVVILLHVP